MTSLFTEYVGIDWTGAKGKRHGGLAVATCAPGSGAPRLVQPPDGHRLWSRTNVATWLSEGLGRRRDERVLVGIDSSFGMPFVDEGVYLPGTALPAAAPELWAHVEALCSANSDFYGGPFVEANAAHYLRPGARGALYRRRMRVPEALAVAGGAGPCESVFHLIGPSQVGLSGLSTMAMLHHLAAMDHVAVWPFQDVTDASVVVVEIYAAVFAAMGGHRGKIRDKAALRGILKAFGIARQPRLGLAFTDHAADACVTAAGLRHIAAIPKYWNPPPLSAMVRRTEGWIFGIV